MANYGSIRVVKICIKFCEAFGGVLSDFYFCEAGCQEICFVLTTAMPDGHGRSYDNVRQKKLDGGNICI